MIVDRSVEMFGRVFFLPENVFFPVFCYLTFSFFHFLFGFFNSEFDYSRFPTSNLASGVKQFDTIFTKSNGRKYITL